MAATPCGSWAQHLGAATWRSCSVHQLGAAAPCGNAVQQPTRRITTWRAKFETLNPSSLTFNPDPCYINIIIAPVPSSALLGFTGFYWVLLGFTWLWEVLMQYDTSSCVIFLRGCISSSSDCISTPDVFVGFSAKRGRCALPLQKDTRRRLSWQWQCSAPQRRKRRGRRRRRRRRVSLELHSLLSS